MPTDPSSTSSSELRPEPPGGSWAAAWIAALVLLAALLGGWEGWLRSQDFEPQLLSGPADWAAAAATLEPDADVIVGTSRDLAAYHPPTWEARRGQVPVNLAVQAGSPLPILAWLANQTDARGLVLVGIATSNTFPADDSQERASRRYIEAYDAWKSSPAKRSEAFLDELLRGNLASRGPSVDLDMLIHGAMLRRPLSPPFVALRDGRWLELEMDVPDAFVDSQLAATQRSRPCIPRDKKRRIEALAHFVGLLEDRGATVVFVHHPTSKGVQTWEDQHWPREQFWDRIPLKTGAAALHHEDDPRTADLDPVDGSHLGRDDAPAYTAALLDRVEALQPR